MLTLCLIDPILLRSWYWEISHMAPGITAVTHNVHSLILNGNYMLNAKSLIPTYFWQDKILLLGLQATGIKVSDYVVTHDDLSIETNSGLAVIKLTPGSKAVYSLAQ